MAKIIDAMLDMIKEMYLNDGPSIDIIGLKKTLKKEWQNHYGLLA